MPVAAAVVGMSVGGINTVSITWMIPFEACTSASVTVAGPTMTVPVLSTLNLTLSPLTMAAIMPSVTSVDATSPETTWWSKISESVAFSSGVSKSLRSIPASAKAWSVGANTVNGPVPCKVVTKPAWDNAATSES